MIPPHDRRVVTALFLLAPLGLFALAQQSADLRDGGLPAGHALLSGVVTADETGRHPVRRAVVTLSAPELPQGRTVISDDRGRYAFGGLPAGRYTVTSSKPAHLTMAYGARYPGRPGVVLPIAAGQQMTNVILRLPRGGVITGAIRDDRGRPAAGATVTLLRAPRSTAATALTPVATTTTDDRGWYRVFGLLPGDYFVFALPPSRMGRGDIQMMASAAVDAALLELEQRSAIPSRGAPLSPRPSPVADAGPDRAPPPFAYAPVYFPGTPVAAAAAAITVREGEEAGGVTFALQLVPTARITGTIVGSTGSVEATQLTLVRQGPRIQPAAAIAFSDRLPLSPILNQAVGAHGEFQYSGVPPGRYTIVARLRPLAGPATSGMASEMHWATAEAEVRGDDVSGIVLALQRALQLSGRIAFDGVTGAPPDDVSGTNMYLQAVGEILGLSETGGAFTPRAEIRRTGEFSIRGILPGRYTLMATVEASSPWRLRSAMFNGMDLADTPIEFGYGADVSDVAVTFTRRQTELSGVLVDTANEPASEYVVVVFSADRAHWWPQSRRLQLARPAADGRFAFRDLPAGAYLVAAVTDLEPGDLWDPEFLEGLRPGAVAVALRYGEPVLQNLRISRIGPSQPPPESP